MAEDDLWEISVGIQVGTISGPNPVEAATRFLESLYRGKKDFGIGLLIKAIPKGEPEGKAYYLRSDVILANAGMYNEAEQMRVLYLKKNI